MQTTPRLRERHHALNLVRSLSTLAAGPYHVMTWNGVVPIESMGTFAAYVFFVQSGLIMMMVCYEGFSCGIAPGVARDFFRKQIARLLPLLVAVAILAGVKQMLVDSSKITSVISTGTGLIALHMRGFLSNSVGRWSLGNP